MRRVLIRVAVEVGVSRAGIPTRDTFYENFEKDKNLNRDMHFILSEMHFIL